MRNTREFPVTVDEVATALAEAGTVDPDGPIGGIGPYAIGLAAEFLATNHEEFKEFLERKCSNEEDEAFPRIFEPPSEDLQTFIGLFTESTRASVDGALQALISIGHMEESQAYNVMTHIFMGVACDTAVIAALSDPTGARSPRRDWWRQSTTLALNRAVEIRRELMMNAFKEAIENDPELKAAAEEAPAETELGEKSDA